MMLGYVVGGLALFGGSVLAAALAVALAGKGRRLFDDLEKSRQLELVSSTAFSNGTVELEYRRRR